MIPNNSNVHDGLQCKGGDYEEVLHGVYGSFEHLLFLFWSVFKSETINCRLSYRLMSDSKLKMDDDEIELIAIGIRTKISQVITNLSPMSIFCCDIRFSVSVTNLGS